jgi:hypothetical protein
VDHPYITAVVAAERARELVAAADRARLARQAAPRESRARRWAERWRRARENVSVPQPGPRLHDYPARKAG